VSVIICDASPLIFLAKLNLLSLVPQILPGKIHLLQCVADEVLSKNAGPAEVDRLRAFFDECSIVAFETRAPARQALSHCDYSTLKWAQQNDADWLVADERLLRRIAIQEGIAVIGFLGLIVEAARRKLLSSDEAKTAISDAISLHQCRISVALYHRLTFELEALTK